MKKYKLALALIAMLLTTSTAFSASGLDKFKEENAKQQAAVVCPLNEAQERRVYQWLQKYTHDFSRLEIVAWSPIYNVPKPMLRKVDYHHVSVKVIVRGPNLSGGFVNQAFHFVMDAEGIYRYSNSLDDGYNVTPMNAATADMGTGKLIQNLLP